MPTLTMPHAEWQATQEQAETFTEGFEQAINAILAPMPPSKRLIYCQHLWQMGQRYGVEVEDADRCSAINHDTGHRNDCGCEKCLAHHNLEF